MKMERKYVVRRRVVFSIAVSALAFAIGTITANLWWTGNGYCWGDMFECMTAGK